MTGLRFPDPIYPELATALLADRSRETCGLALARHDPASGSWLVAEAGPVPEDAYERREPDAAVLRAEFVVDVANRCRRDGFSAVFMHTHPFDPGVPSFSPIDDAGESALRNYLGRRAPEGVHLAMVVGPAACRVRLLGRDVQVPAWQVGTRLVPLCGGVPDGECDPRHDRQARAFGEPGQRLIGNLRVGVVGVGGTGSVVVQQLAHLGVKDLLLIDPDEVDPTNLNRLLGSTAADVGRPKVEVAARTVHAVAPGAKVETLARDVVDSDVAPRLAAMDFIFICTDSHASRAVVCQLAYQYLVPAIDMGVSITVAGGAVTHVTGRVQMLAPTLECLLCTGALDPESIRRETMTPEQRASDPYVQGVREPQPAVVSLNSTMASFAVTMFLGAVTPVPAGPRFQLYDGIRGTVRPTGAERDPHCIVCSPSGALARGPTWPLPTRFTCPAAERSHALAEP